MRLYITPTSPYGRIVRIVLQEKGLAGLVTVVSAQTRTPGSPYYDDVPSGRVPYLDPDDGSAPGRGLEDSALICRYLDQFDGAPRLHPAPDARNWDYGRLEATARSMLDGLAVYIREVRRPLNEQSPTILTHEIERARRLARQWNELVAHPLMLRPVNMAQIILYVALDTSLRRNAFDWRPGSPALLAWYEGMAVHPSIAATA